MSTSGKKYIIILIYYIDFNNFILRINNNIDIVTTRAVAHDYP